MLCPEVWNFPPPAAFHDFKRDSFANNSAICDKIINEHHFNHLVSVVLPNTTCTPDSLTSILDVDSEYYKVLEVNISDLISKEFIEAFVKRGQLTVLSDNTRIDVEDCMCITCSGQLVFNLLRETYVKLGLEGKPSLFSSGKPTRYIVTIDLCSPSFIPGKNNFERAREVLQNNLHAFNVLLVWEPSDEKVCPSSVASYLHHHGYSVQLCRPRATQRQEMKVMVPGFPAEINKREEGGEDEAEELLEWLGAFSLQVDLASGSPGNFVSTYEPPSTSILCPSVLVLEWRGFFSVQRICKLYTLLREFSDQHKVSPWASLHVQGFADSPLSWGKKEHSFFTEGDNHYTLFLQPSHFVACRVLSSSRRPRSVTKRKK